MEFSLLNGTLLTRNSEAKPTKLDAARLFRSANYGEGKKGDEWVQLLTCETWVHRECVGYFRGCYTCD